MTVDSPRNDRADADEVAAPAMNDPFRFAAQALHAAAQASAATNNGNPTPDLMQPDGWRWRVLRNLEQLSRSVVHDYSTAKEKQKHQAWESWVGKLATGGSAGVGALLAAVGAGYAKTSSGWGWVIAVVGVVVAVGGSIFSANNYVQNRQKKLRYMRLMYDLPDYASFVLPTADPDAVFTQLDAFRQLWETAGS